MLDFTLQILGIAAGLILGSCLYSWIQVNVASKMGDDSPTNEHAIRFWSLKSFDIIGCLSMVFFHVGWIKSQFLRPQTSVSPRITILLCVFLPAVALFIAALFFTALLKSTVTILPSFALFLEGTTRTLLTLMVTMLLPLPPLDGWKLISTLLWGKIRPGSPYLFPGVLLILILLEFLFRIPIIAVLFGTIVDTLLSFLFLIA